MINIEFEDLIGVMPLADVMKLAAAKSELEYRRLDEIPQTDRQVDFGEASTMRSK